MSIVPAKPVVFISYSHKDEPEQRPPEGEIYWLREIQSHLQPAVRRANGTFEIWTDENMAGGADWESDIKAKLAVCDICILLVSRHSLASDYVIDIEVETIRRRRENGEQVQIYPIVLSPFPKSALPVSLEKLNLRPRVDKPLSGFSHHQRTDAISTMVDEIVGMLSKKPTPATPPKADSPKTSVQVDITDLPETAYENLVGREAELKHLDDAWADPAINIISLVAEGGAGKSALVNGRADQPARGQRYRSVEERRRAGRRCRTAIGRGRRRTAA
jgi:hypothetical protein